MRFNSVQLQWESEGSVAPLRAEEMIECLFANLSLCNKVSGGGKGVQLYRWPLEAALSLQYRRVNPASLSASVREHLCVRGAACDDAQFAKCK